MPNMTISAILCLIGAVYGVYVIIRHLKVFSGSVNTSIKHFIPVALGTLSWMSAAYTFYSMGIDSEVDAPRVFMLISWCIFASRYKGTYTSCKINSRLRKRKKVVVKSNINKEIA